jgi:ABC-2 type transport system ATP-binding protein
MISVDNLCASINGRDVLKGIELHLAPGDIYGLLGPNGAGKSTTIFILLGLRSRNSGRVTVLEMDPKDQALEIRRSLGVMPERCGFYEWMTPLGYLRWYARLYGRSSKDGDLHELLEKVGLKGVYDSRIGVFSRGMKQRLAVARAVVHGPKLLILDEPTSGLDPQGRRDIHDLLLDFVRREGGAVLLCTHLLDDVDRLCNRIGIVDHGRTLLEGSPTEVISNQAGGSVYRLRLERLPDTSILPEGLTLLAKRGDWVHVQLQHRTPETLSSIWGKLFQRGWRISEIRSESPGLEELYLNITDQRDAPFQEKTL